MSLSSISPPLPGLAEQQNMGAHIRASSNIGCSTVCKVIAVVATAFISIAALVLGGPMTAVVVALLCGASLLGLFNGCVSSHQHGTWFMNGHAPRGGHDPHDYHGRGPIPHGQGNPAVPGHVIVGGGHFRGGAVPPQHGHGPVGGHPPAPGHAPVGGGHYPGAGPTQVPPPSGAGGHVPVGGGRRG